MEDGNNGGLISREKIDQLASWFSETVTTAFFSSLERFACVNIATADFDDDDDRPISLASPSLVIDFPDDDVARLPGYSFGVVMTEWRMNDIRISGILETKLAS